MLKDCLFILFVISNFEVFKIKCDQNVLCAILKIYTIWLMCRVVEYFYRWFLTILLNVFLLKISLIEEMAMLRWMVEMLKISNVIRCTGASFTSVSQISVSSDFGRKKCSGSCCLNRKKSAVRVDIFSLLIGLWNSIEIWDAEEIFCLHRGVQGDFLTLR